MSYRFNLKNSGGAWSKWTLIFTLSVYFSLAFVSRVGAQPPTDNDEEREISASLTELSKIPQLSAPAPICEPNDGRRIPLEDQETLRHLEKYLTQIDASACDYLRRFLMRQSELNPLYKKLLAPLTKPGKADHGLSFNALYFNDELQDEKTEKYLFHGTRATLEVLSSWELRNSTSKSGPGIYFGRNLSTSADYFSDISSNIHRTWKDKLVRSVLVLNKDDPRNFKSQNAGMGGTVKEYVSDADSYSLDHLKSIVFAKKEDLDAFIRFFGSQNELMKEKLKKVELYRYDYCPLSDEKNHCEFMNAIDDHQDTFLNDVEFHKFFIGRVPSLNKEMINSKLAKSVLGSTVRDEKTLVSLTHLAAENKANSAILAIVESLSPEEFTKVLLHPGSDYSKTTVFDTLLEEKNNEALQSIFKKLARHPNLIEKVAQSIKSLDEVDDIETAHPLQEGLVGSSNYPELLLSLAGGILRMPNPESELEERTFSSDQKRKAFIERRFGSETKFKEMIKESEKADQVFLEIADKIPHLIATPTKDGSSLPIKAFRENRYNLVKGLATSAPESLKLKDKQGNFPLLLSAKVNSDLFEAVLKGAPEMLTEKNKMNETSAHIAAEHNQVQVPQTIARNKEVSVILSAKDKSDSTPLDKAAGHSSSLEAFKFILSCAPDSLNSKNRHGWSPVATAANHGNLEAVEHVSAQFPDFVRSDISQIVERAAINDPRIIRFLGNKFPDQLPQTIHEAKKNNRVPEVVTELEEMKSKSSNSKDQNSVN